VADSGNGDKKLMAALAGFTGIIVTVGYITLGSMLFAGKRTEADVAAVKTAAQEERDRNDARLAEIKCDISEIKVDIKTLLERHASLNATVRAELGRSGGVNENPS